MDLHPGAGAGDSPALCPLGQGSARSRWRSRAFHSHRAPSRWPGADTRLPRRRSPGTGAEAPGLRHPERDPAHGACAHADSQGPVRAVTPAANRSRQRRRAPAPPRPASPRPSALAPPLGAGPAPARFPGFAACALPRPARSRSLALRREIPPEREPGRVPPGGSGALGVAVGARWPQVGLCAAVDGRRGHCLRRRWLSRSSRAFSRYCLSSNVAPLRTEL